MNERDTEIIDRFKNSWLKTEQHYIDLLTYSGWDKVKAVKDFVSKNINIGNDLFYRAGNSMYILVLSRSVDHGLRDDQKRLIIEAVTEGDYEVTLKDGEKIYGQYKITDLNDDRLLKLMETLKRTLVD